MEQEIREALTRETILAMQPGRELDHIIGEKVMGAYQINNDTVYNLKWRIADALHLHMPPYSTDMSAAWEVVEMISDKKFNVYVTRRSDGMHFTECKKVGSSADRLFEVFAEAPTAPEAICKAALLTTLGDNHET